MKVLGVVLGAMLASACGGEPEEAAVAGTGEIPGGPGGDPEPELEAPATASAFEILHGGYDGPERPPSAAVLRAVGRGAGRLASLQADTIGDNAQNGLNDSDPDDSGWDFTLPSTASAHSPRASPPNLFGETGLGLWAALDADIAGARTLTAALDTGTGMQRNPDIDSPPDFTFAVLLAELTVNRGFAELARERYDARLTAAGGAAAFGTFIRDARAASNDAGLIAYDLGWLTLSAAALDAQFPGAGYAADAATYAGIVVDDLTSGFPKFNVEDRTEGSYTIGLAWSQVAASWLDDRARFAELRRRLLLEQHGNGAWGTSATLPADDLQSTAIALETIALTGRSSLQTQRAVRLGVELLLRGQAVSGGWPDASNIELPLVDAEIILALALTRSDGAVNGLVPDLSRSTVTAAGSPGRHASPSP